MSGIKLRIPQRTYWYLVQGCQAVALLGVLWLWLIVICSL
jgi:hypothetical protein